MSNTSLTLIDVYERAVERPLKRADLSRTPLSPNEASKLAIALNDHYRVYELDGKDASELRPSISARYPESKSVGFNYVSGAMHYTDGFKYKFDQSLRSEMTESIKKYLLYCHSLVIEDPLPYLLDYFRHDALGEHAIRRLPAVNALLAEYADIAELIQRRIIFPVSEKPILHNDIPFLRDDWSVALHACLPQIKETELSVLVERVFEEQYRRPRFNNRVNLFFPKTDYVLVLREVLKLTQQQFSSSAIAEPFDLAMLGGIATINSSLLSTQDVVRIRSDSEVFEEWRAFLKKVFNNVHVREHSFSSLEDEYSLSVREEFMYWKHGFAEKLQGSTLSRALKASVGNIGVGVMAGAISGAITGGPDAALLGSAIGGGVGGGVQPIIELFKNLISAGSKKPSATTLRHHFLALGLSDRELPR